MMMFAFSAVSFPDRFIPALTFNKLLASGSATSHCTGLFGKQSCTQLPMLF